LATTEFAQPNQTFVQHFGGCHCGRVKFAIAAPAEIEATECNCSICTKSGFLHLIVPKTRFNLLHGAEFLAEYRFNSGVAKHLFCKVCGIKSFYVPRSNPDGYSVNVHCIEPGTIDRVNITQFDGLHWEVHAHELVHLSAEYPTLGASIKPTIGS
jgi:centromere protein V